MDRKAKLVLPVLLVLFSFIVYAAQTISLTIPNSVDNEGSVITWGETGIYRFTVDGIDPNQAAACAVPGNENCHWRVFILLNGVNQWDGNLFEPVGQISALYHIKWSIADLGDGKGEIKFEATPPANAFAGAPYTTWTWHGIEYQTWVMSAIIRERQAIQQIAGSIAVVVIETKENINEFLTADTAPVDGGIDHLNYSINDPEMGVLPLSIAVRDINCSERGGYKDGFETFRDGELKLAIESIEELDKVREAQAADYMSYTVKDAIEIQDAINLAASRYETAVEIYTGDGPGQFNGCACVAGC